MHFSESHERKKNNLGSSLITSSPSALSLSHMKCIYADCTTRVRHRQSACVQQFTVQLLPTPSARPTNKLIEDVAKYAVNCIKTHQRRASCPKLMHTLNQNRKKCAFAECTSVAIKNASLFQWKKKKKKTMCCLLANDDDDRWWSRET